MISWFLKLLPEEKQGVLGLVYACLTVSYYFALVKSGLVEPTLTNKISMAVIPVSCLLLAIAIIKFKKHRINLRKVLILNYFSCTTVGLFLFGEYAFINYFWYLYLIIGSGVRYGNTYMFIVAIMCFFGQTSLYLFQEFWGRSIYIYIGLSLNLLIIPLYVSVLNIRMNRLLTQARVANEEKDRFISTMSHELRTPLTGVITASQLIDQKSLTPKNTDLLGTIKNSSDELLTLINQVLDFSKIESSDRTERSDHFIPYLLVNECLSILQPTADQKGLMLDVLLQDNFQKPVICDEQKLRQILINIIGNAVKFTEIGSVCIEISLDTTDLNQTQLVLNVIDTGVGISKKDQESIFQPFKQADEGIARKFEGSGLGTTISKKLVEQLSGTLHLDSKRNVGTNVCITIPVTISEMTFPANISNYSTSFSGFDKIPENILRATEQVGCKLLDKETQWADFFIKPSPLENTIALARNGTQQKLNLRNPTAEKISHALALMLYSTKQSHDPNTQAEVPHSILNKSVLIVDDNLTNRTIIQMILNEMGIQTQTANSGPEALELMNHHDYDLFIFDRHMPEMSGNELLAKTREFYDKEIPSILLTADISEEAAKEADASGFSTRLYKPFEPTALTEQVIQLLTH